MCATAWSIASPSSRGTPWWATWPRRRCARKRRDSFYSLKRWIGHEKTDTHPQRYTPASYPARWVVGRTVGRLGHGAQYSAGTDLGGAAFVSLRWGRWHLQPYEPYALRCQ